MFLCIGCIFVVGCIEFGDLFFRFDKEVESYFLCLRNSKFINMEVILCFFFLVGLILEDVLYYWILGCVKLKLVV